MEKSRVRLSQLETRFKLGLAIVTLRCLIISLKLSYSLVPGLARLGGLFEMMVKTLQPLSRGCVEIRLVGVLRIVVLFIRLCDNENIK